MRVAALAFESVAARVDSALQFRSGIHRHIDRVVAAVNAALPGSYTEVEIPFE